MKPPSLLRRTYHRAHGARPPQGQLARGARATPLPTLGVPIVGALLGCAGGVIYQRRNDESVRRTTGVTTGRPGLVPAGTLTVLAIVR